jgi:hypothetical protein
VAWWLRIPFEPIQVQEASRTPDLTKIEIPHDILSLNNKHRERILKPIREIKQVTYKGKPSKSQQISQQKS